MRWLAAVTVSVLLASGLSGCSDSDHLIDLGSGGSEAGAAGSSAGSTSSGHAGSTGHAGSGSSGGPSAGASGSGEAGAGTAGEATGGTSAGTGGAAAGSGGALAGSGGVAAGSGGAAAGSGGAAAGSGGAAAGSGGGTGGSGGAADTVPSDPTAVAIDTTSPFSVTVSWTDNSNNETGFEVYWSADGTKPATSTHVAANSTSFKLSAIDANTTYHFWVEAVNATGSSNAATQTAAAATTDFVWDELWLDTANTIHFKAHLVGDATTPLYGYHSPSATNKGTATSMAPYLLWNATNDGVDITQLSYFWVEARNADGSLFSRHTLAPSGDIANLAATAADLSVDLSWDAATGAQGYQTFWGTDALLTNALFAGTPTTSPTTIVGLNPGTSYNFWVRSVGLGYGGTGFPGNAALITKATTGAPLGANLAFDRVVTASSVNGGNIAANLTDGKYNTRLESTASDPQWVYVDLTAAHTITDVKLVWEGAYSKSFAIQVCDDTCTDAGLAAMDASWTTVYSADRTLSGGFPNFELIHLPTASAGRFVRLLGITRINTNWSHSLYELEVYSAP